MEKMNKPKFRKNVVYFTDAIIRGLIAFLILGIGGYLLFVGVFGISFIYWLPIVFILSVFLSPIFSKINLGEKLITRYERLLERVTRD